MPVTTIRLDEDDLRYLDDIAEGQKLDRTSLIKKAIKLGVSDILLDNALEKYKKGTCSAWECARQARVSLWEFLEELRKREIYLRTDEIELENALKELT